VKKEMVFLLDLKTFGDGSWFQRAVNTPVQTGRMLFLPILTYAYDKKQKL